MVIKTVDTFVTTPAVFTILAHLHKLGQHMMMFKRRQKIIIRSVRIVVQNQPITVSQILGQTGLEDDDFSYCSFTTIVNEVDYSLLRKRKTM